MTPTSAIQNHALDRLGPEPTPCGPPAPSWWRLRKMSMSVRSRGPGRMPGLPQPEPPRKATVEGAASTNRYSPLSIVRPQYVTWISRRRDPAASRTTHLDAAPLIARRQLGRADRRPSAFSKRNRLRVFLGKRCALRFDACLAEGFARRLFSRMHHFAQCVVIATDGRKAPMRWILG